MWANNRGRVTALGGALALLCLGGVVPQAAADDHEAAAATPAESQTAAPEGDALMGRRIAFRCSTCHGRSGVAAIPIAPHIGGENPDYIRRQLAAFRDGERVHEMMTVVARDLSNADIANLAAWYGSMVPETQLPRGHLDHPETPNLCLNCHSETGETIDPDAPNIAGESVVYILNQLKSFRSGKREHEIMSMVAEDMTDAEMREAAEWFAAIRFDAYIP